MIVGIKSAPIKKPFRTPISVDVNPRIVAIKKVINPKNPENVKITEVKKIKIMKEIFE